MAKLVEFSPEESQEKIIQYIKSDKKDSRIIGLYAKAKQLTFENNVQLSRFFRRHVRAAKELDCYSDDRIISTMKYLIDNSDFKWVLSTLLKYIDEGVDQLDGKKPIIVLKDGTTIYSVERIKQLERDGKIYYDNRKWVEVS